MAELLGDRNIQDMSDEILGMQNSMLFTQEHIGLILKSRKEFENKINGVSKNLRDFKDYINNEQAILKHISKRCNESGFRGQKEVIEYSILKRIKRLYEIALKRFSDDLTFYSSYLKFCKQRNKQPLPMVVDTVIKACESEPRVFQITAEWYTADLRNLNKALKFFNNGISHHKTSKLLYKGAIKLLLSVLKATSTKLDKAFEDKVCNQIDSYLKSICTNISTNIEDVEYIIEILHLLEECKETLRSQNIITDYLLGNYAKLDFVWHTVAQRKRRGLYESQQGSKETPLMMCLATYREGLQVVDGSHKVALCSQYLDCIREAKLEANSEITTDLLNRELEEASKQKCLSETHYLKWVEEVKDHDKTLDILEKGTLAFPQSVDLWKLRLCYATLTEKNATVDQIFKDGVKNLQNRSLPLWLMFIRYYESLYRDAVVLKTYEDGTDCEQFEEISNALKPKYIEWLARTSGVTAARNAYNMLYSQEPFCKELHKTMSIIESTNITYDFIKWENVHRNACEQFGNKDIDVWINYIQFGFYLLGQNSQRSNIIQQILEKAGKVLDVFSYDELKKKLDELSPKNIDKSQIY